MARQRSSLGSGSSSVAPCAGSSARRSQAVEQDRGEPRGTAGVRLVAGGDVLLCREGARDERQQVVDVEVPAHRARTLCSSEQDGGGVAQLACRGGRSAAEVELGACER